MFRRSGTTPAGAPKAANRPNRDKSGQKGQTVTKAPKGANSTKRDETGQSPQKGQTRPKATKPPKRDRPGRGRPQPRAAHHGRPAPVPPELDQTGHRPVGGPIGAVPG